MKKSNLANDSYLAYPGSYTPTEKAKDLNEDITSVETIPPRANITETPDGYKIELVVPGMKKEDFIVTVNEKVLTVLAVNKDPELKDGEAYCLHEFSGHNFRRDIILPVNADATIVNAAYKSGILC